MFGFINFVIGVVKTAAASYAAEKAYEFGSKIARKAIEKCKQSKMGRMVMNFGKKVYGKISSKIRTPIEWVATKVTGVARKVFGKWIPQNITDKGETNEKNYYKVRRIIYESDVLTHISCVARKYIVGTSYSENLGIHRYKFFALFTSSEGPERVLIIKYEPWHEEIVIRTTVMSGSLFQDHLRAAEGVTTVKSYVGIYIKLGKIIDIVKDIADGKITWEKGTCLPDLIDITIRQR